MGLSKKAPVIAKKSPGFVPTFLNSPLATDKSVIESRFNGPGFTGK